MLIFTLLKKILNAIFTYFEKIGKSLFCNANLFLILNKILIHFKLLFIFGFRFLNDYSRALNWIDLELIFLWMNIIEIVEADFSI